MGLKLDEIPRHVLERSSSDEVEALIINKDTSLTRYANSVIHQNINKEETKISIRAVNGKRVGASSTTSLDEDSVIRCLKNAENISKHQPEDPDFKGLPEEMGGDVKERRFDKDTAEHQPEKKASLIKNMIDYASNEGVDRLYGAFVTEKSDVIIVNSKGIDLRGTITDAHLTSTAIADWDNDCGFGWGEACSTSVKDIDHMEVVSTAVEKGLKNMNTSPINPGEYTVVLEPLAVKDLLTYTAMMGLRSKAVQEERSFMNGKFGQQIMDERVSIIDDVYHPMSGGFYFDFEGVPKQRVDMIHEGVAKAVVYDSYTAGREEGKKSTGHALPMPNPYSPMPMNMMMETGEGTLEEMIEETDKGILVTRFNYLGIIHPVKSILTGLTRDGTWMIEDGEIKRPLKNLRFTQSMLEAFNDVDSIGKELKLYPMGWLGGKILAPALKLDKFNFTGTTEF